MLIIQMEEKKEQAAIPVKVDEIDVENGSRLSIKRPIADFFPEGEVAVSDRPVEVEVSLNRFGNDIYVTGVAKGSIRLQCGRCLADYRQALEVELNASFIDESDADAGEYDEEVYVYDGVTVDLYPLAREQLLLALPLKPLCKEDCKGLCPKCGADLNEKDCGCRRGEVDKRFAVLARLKKDL
jgi:uncharacterized protein